MTTYWHNKTKVIVLTILIILWGAICIQKATGGTYTDSIHGGGWSGIDGVDRSTIDAKYSNYADGNCAHCHEAHASLGGSEPSPVDGGPDKALSFSEEEHLCEECHDANGPARKDIKTMLDYDYRHPAHDISGKHTLSKLEYGQGGAPFRGVNRHAECCDCHNPHTIGGIDPTTPITHVDIPANRTLDGNKIYHATFGSAALQGVWGVEPNSWPGEWQSPTSFTETLPSSNPPYPRYAEKEYQICFKCHSYYGLGSSTDDVAKEFNPNNASGHPVVVTANDRSGSDPPQALLVTSGWEQLRTPWKLNKGNTTMYCTDCHSNPLKGALDPVGPHGSPVQYMKTVSFQSGGIRKWPYSTGVTPWTLLDLIDGYDDYNWKYNLFCYGCHPIRDADGSQPFLNKVHNHIIADYGVLPQNAPCTNCHVTNIHGAKNARLIRDDVWVFNKASHPGSYEIGDCIGVGLLSGLITYGAQCSQHDP